MRNHNTDLPPIPTVCLEPQLEPLRPAGARVAIAHLVSLSYERAAVAIVARKCGVAESTAFAWRSPLHPGPRLSDVLCGPRSWAELLLRGGLGLLLPRPHLAPRSALGMLLSDLGALLAEVDTPIEEVSDEELRARARRARSAEQAAANLAAGYEAELLRRREAGSKGAR